MAKTTNKFTLRFLDRSQGEINLQPTPILIHSLVEDIRSVCETELIYIVEWTEENSLDDNKDPNSFSLVYRTEMSAKALAFDLAINLKNSEYFSIYVPRCKQRTVQSVMVYVLKKELAICINCMGKKMRPKIGVLFSDYLGESMKAHYLGEQCTNFIYIVDPTKTEEKK